jgi:hypothetical protein
METGAQVIFTEAENGTPNALDFQLLALMLLDCRDSWYEHIVISGDTGYDCAIRMARTQDVDGIYRFRNIEEFVSTRVIAEEKEQKKDTDQQKAVKIGFLDEDSLGLDELIFSVADTENDTSVEKEDPVVITDCKITEPVHDDPLYEEKSEDLAQKVNDMRFGVVQLDDSEVDRVLTEEERSDTDDRAWDLNEPAWGVNEHIPESKETSDEDIEDIGSSSIPKVAGKKKRIRIKNYLHEKGIDLNQVESAMVSAALNETDTKKQFYQYFQKKMGKKGIAFYNMIKQEYNVIKAI